MRSHTETQALAELVDELARGPATLDDWRRADLRARTALLCAAVRGSFDEVEQLWLLRMCIESRMFELEAGGAPAAH